MLCSFHWDRDREGRLGLWNCWFGLKTLSWKVLLSSELGLPSFQYSPPFWALLEAWSPPLPLSVIVERHLGTVERKHLAQLLFAFLSLPQSFGCTVHTAHFFSFIDYYYFFICVVPSKELWLMCTAVHSSGATLFSRKARDTHFKFLFSRICTNDFWNPFQYLQTASHPLIYQISKLV